MFSKQNVPVENISLQFDSCKHAGIVERSNCYEKGFDYWLTALKSYLIRYSKISVILFNNKRSLYEGYSKSSISNFGCNVNAYSTV